MNDTITDLLMRFRTAKVPADAREMMRLSLFDWAACGIAGARSGEFDDFADGGTDEAANRRILGLS